MATYTATGVTLTVAKYKGTERLAAFHTLEHGKVEATVRGVGKPGSKLAPAVELFTLSRLQFAEGRNLDRLTQGEVIEPFYDLRRDLKRLALASYVVELVAATTEPKHPEPEVFEALVRTLGTLSVAGRPELAAWGFVLRYLCLHGSAPVLDVCVECGASLEGGVRYAAGLGACVCPRCLPTEGGLRVSAPARAAMRSLASLAPDRLDRLRLGDEVVAQVRDLVLRHVRHHMGVALKSEDFLAKMGW